MKPNDPSSVQAAQVQTRHEEQIKKRKVCGKLNTITRQNLVMRPTQLAQCNECQCQAVSDDVLVEL